MDQQEDDGKSGRFLLVLPSTPDEAQGLIKKCREASKRRASKMVVIGAPKNADVILSLGQELLALHQIKESDPRLLGDEVARREVYGHLADVNARLESELQQGLTSATWFVDGEIQEITGKDSLTALASTLAEQRFHKAPRIFSELVNRHRPTRNSQAGVRELLLHMVRNDRDMCLGMEGFPAERGLYDTILANAGLHRQDSEQGLGFYGPDLKSKDGKTYQRFWKAGEDWLRALSDLTSLADLYDLWSAPPFGLQRGVLPILALAFLLSHRDELAIHAETVFQTEDDLRDGTFVDCLYRDPRLIQVRFVPPSNPEHLNLLREISQAVCDVTGRASQRESLALAQQLKSFSDRLHPWVHKTRNLTKSALALRQILHKASDPNKLLFEDIPTWHESAAREISLRKCLKESMTELSSTYEAMLRRLEGTLWEALGVVPPVDFGQLHLRAERVHGVSGDLRMDAFASRLAELDGSIPAIEGLCAFALNKPTREWLGNDPDQAKFQLIEISDRFRKTETFADFCGKEVGRQGMALIVREGKSYSTMIQYFDVGDEDQGQLKGAIASFRASLAASGLNPRLKLAALAAVTAEILSTDGGRKK